jgi:2-haloacid dehalogenase
MSSRWCRSRPSDGGNPHLSPTDTPPRRAASRTERMALVAAHGWDTHGAHQAGLLTGWVSRLEGHWNELFDQPDVTGPDLVDVVRGLLALGEPAQ